MTFSFKLIKGGKNITVASTRWLGEGAFGACHEVRDNTSGKTYALKIVDLNFKDKAKKRTWARFTKNEMSALKSMGLLEGGKIEGNKAYFLMKKVAGENALTLLLRQQNAFLFGGLKPTSPSVDKDKLRQSCFNALIAVHRHGFTHNDMDGNFLYDQNTNHATLVDFGLSRQDDWLSRLTESYLLVNAFETLSEAQKITSTIPNPMIAESIRVIQNTSFSHQANLCYKLAKFYANEMAQYAKDNKIQFAQNILFYGALTISAVSGLGLISGAYLIALEFAKSFALKGIANYFLSKSHTAERWYWLHGNEYEPVKHTHKNDMIVYQVLSGLFVVLGLGLNLRTTGPILSQLLQIGQHTSPLTLQYFQTLANTIKPQELVLLTSLYLPVKSAYDFSCHVAEQVLPTNIIEKYANMIGTQNGPLDIYNIPTKTMNYMYETTHNGVDYLRETANRHLPNVFSANPRNRR